MLLSFIVWTIPVDSNDEELEKGLIDAHYIKNRFLAFSFINLEIGELVALMIHLIGGLCYISQAF